MQHINVKQIYQYINHYLIFIIYTILLYVLSLGKYFIQIETSSTIELLINYKIYYYNKYLIIYQTFHISEYIM